eukprot:4836378-Pleurochrysis_carterae.AAC.4
MQCDRANPERLKACTLHVWLSSAAPWLLNQNNDAEAKLSEANFLILRKQGSAARGFEASYLSLGPICEQTWNGSPVVVAASEAVDQKERHRALDYITWTMSNPSDAMVGNATAHGLITCNTPGVCSPYSTKTHACSCKSPI